MQVVIKNNQRDVGGVKHQFDRHQNPQDVSAGEHAINSNTKNNSGQCQAVIEGHDFFSCPKRTAPTKAASKINETASNGRSISPSSNRPRGAEVGTISTGLT